MEDHPGTIELIDRKSYIQTVKQILTNFTENMNHCRPKSEPIKLLDYVKNVVLDLMIRADDNMKKTHAVAYMTYSSDTDTDSGVSNQTRIDIYKQVIEDYLGTGVKKTSWHKQFVKARVIDNLNFVHNL